jgi:hypothetical protein
VKLLGFKDYQSRMLETFLDCVWILQKYGSIYLSIYLYSFPISYKRKKGMKKNILTSSKTKFGPRGLKKIYFGPNCLFISRNQPPRSLLGFDGKTELVSFHFNQLRLIRICGLNYWYQ